MGELDGIRAEVAQYLFNSTKVTFDEQVKSGRLGIYQELYFFLGGCVFVDFFDGVDKIGDVESAELEFELVVKHPVIVPNVLDNELHDLSRFVYGNQQGRNIQICLRLWAERKEVLGHRGNAVKRSAELMGEGLEHFFTNFIGVLLLYELFFLLRVYESDENVLALLVGVYYCLNGEVVPVDWRVLLVQLDYVQNVRLHLFFRDCYKLLELAYQLNQPNSAFYFRLKTQVALLMIRLVRVQVQ